MRRAMGAQPLQGRDIADLNRLGRIVRYPRRPGFGPEPRSVLQQTMRVVLKPLGLVVVLLLIAVLSAFAIRGCFSRSTPATASTGSGHLVILSDTAKRPWTFDQVTLFNYASRDADGQQHIYATWQDMDTRKALQAILNDSDAIKPVVWIPNGSYWAAALNDGWRRQHPSSGDLVHLNDTGSYRVFLRTPLVFLMTADRQRVLRPLLDGSQRPSWAVFHDLCSGEIRPPWGGAFHCAVADPLSSDSGFSMLGMVLVAYGQKTEQASSLDALPGDPKFLQYLDEMHPAFVRYPGAASEEGALGAAFAKDPSHADVLVTYESNALAAVSKNPRLAVVYPDPAPVADQSAVVLDGPWVSPEQRAAARPFLDFLSRGDALRDGVRKHYRPAETSDQYTLQPELDRYQRFGFQESFTSVEPPPYDAVNDVAYAWSQMSPTRPVR
jgi:hypothetical protein